MPNRTRPRPSLLSRVLAAAALASLCAGCPAVPGDDVCDPNPCTLGQRTVCTEVDGTATCSCREGFSDVAGACVQPGPCATSPCVEAHRGVCREQGEAAVCLCDDGYRDDGAGACVAAQTCTPNPCQQPNRTQCAAAGGAVTCGCDPGFRDDGSGGCVSANPCAVNPCTQPNRTVCVASGATAICQCESGYVDQAGQCVEAARCSPNPCTQPNRGRCSDVGGTAVCGCDVGFEDRGGACVPSDPCSPNPCTRPHQGVCASGGDAGVQCSCEPGFQPGANGCEPVPPPTCVGQHTDGDAYEPDECPALAKDILPGVPQSHTVDPAGDFDFVRFSVDAGAIVLLEETGALSAALTLYGPDGVTVLQTANNPDRIATRLASAGTYFLRVRAASPSATGATTIALTDLGVDDQADGETGANTLTPTSAGAVLSGTFDYGADWDVLAVPVQAGRVYRFEETSGTDVYVRLTAGPRTTLVPAQDAPEAFSWKATATGALYFGVRHANAAATGSWLVRVTDLGVDDQADGETGANTLTPTSAGAVLSGTFDYGGDWDVLAVPVQAGRVYRFEETSGTDTYVRLTSGAGTALVPTQDAPEFFQWRAATTGALFFGLRNASVSATGSWLARVTDVGVDDHPDTRAGATALTVGAAATPGALQFIGDVDYFTFTAVAGALSVRVVATGSVDLRVESASGAAVTWGSSPVTLTFSVPAPGTYFVRVSRTALESYSVRVSH